MLKEKINHLLNKEGDNKKKVENLIFLLVILIVTIITINYIWNDNETQKDETNKSANKQLASADEQQEANDNENSLENKLENILSQIEGVGEVNVLLTYNESTEIVPVYNKTEKTSNTTEEDSGGGTRNIEESDISQEVVYEEKDGSGSIATQKTVSPKIEGAVITATGANNSVVKTNIVQAVEAATGLATHKIQVFEKQK